MTTDTTSNWSWDRKDDILDCNRQMLERQCACDVFFRVGESQARHGAHKFSLVSRSSVFAAMFCGSLQESKGDIDIPDVESPAFGQLLRYIYTGDAELTADNVLPVLYAANKYDISGLARACVNFVEEQLDIDNACTLLEQAHVFSEQEFRSRVLEMILRKGNEVLESEDIVQLCHQCLVDVIGADNLICKEQKVFEAVDRWAGGECERRGLEKTDANKRIMLGPAIYHVRFPLLHPADFVGKVVCRSLLSEEEKVDVMRHFLVTSNPSMHFSSEPRKNEKHRRVNRFESRHAMAWNNKSGENAVSFMVNKDIFIEGFMIYGTCRSGSHVLQVEGTLLDSADHAMTQVSCDVITSSNVDVYDVLFDQGRRLSRDTWYTLTAGIQGSHTYAGQNGRLSAFNGEVVFTFSSTEKSHTGTGLEQGQLPGLIFSQCQVS